MTAAAGPTEAAMPTLIQPRGHERLSRYVARFNSVDREDIINLVPNAAAEAWMSANIPFFDCPDPTIEEVYYYRWWTFRKHIKQTPAGTIVTEFIAPVRHAGLYNSISCALGLHIAEGRWLHDQHFLDQYIRFWFTAGPNGTPEPRFHFYSSWLAWALRDRAMVTGNIAGLVAMLDDLVADYRQWESEKLRSDGLFWQFDVRDGMEESISGSRTHRNARPTINSYMFASATAIADLATRAGRPELAAEFAAKASGIRRLVHQRLWDPGARFFKAQTREAGLSSAREAIGYIPWCFDLPEPGHEDAWAQLVDPEGFWAPAGLTTAERRHPRFRSNGVGRCEWDGAVWPFATSQTLTALANVLRRYQQKHVTRAHYLEAVQTYARAHRREGQPYIGEYHDEQTGEWLKGDNPRSRYYNHSTFADLVISGLAGVCPRLDDVIEIDPLVPVGAWDYFAVEGIPYHGRLVSVLWDAAGTRYHRGPGLHVMVDGKTVARSNVLERLIARLD